MSYILCNGGLGNQMFQYAFYKNLVLKGKEANLDTSYFKHFSVHCGYELERCFGINVPESKKDHFNKFWQFVYKVMSKLHKNKFMSVKMESYIKEQYEERIAAGDIIYGYWQSEKYFKDSKQEVINDFKFKNLSEKTVSMAEKIENTESVSVHIRRGDYLGLARFVNLSETDYYKNAIEKVCKSAENPVFYVFSDDVEWCKANMKFPGATVFVDFNKGNDSYQDMYLMSRAKYSILANSSFSWWAGYLGNHKMVLRPSKYKTVWTEEQDKVLYPDYWEKVEV